ncbi:MAG: hypothetical protein AB7O59_08955 [Pirellulales bacterium]
MDTSEALASKGEEVPAWYNVLEGMCDEHIADFNATLVEGVRLR